MPRLVKHSGQHLCASMALRRPGVDGEAWGGGGVADMSSNTGKLPAPSHHQELCSLQGTESLQAVEDRW